MGSLRHARHINVRSHTASILDSGVEISSAHFAGALSPARITRVTSFPRWLTLSMIAIIPSPPVARLWVIFVAGSAIRRIDLRGGKGVRPRWPTWVVPV